MTMRLQINGEFGWNEALSFDDERTHEVEDAAASLARASGNFRMRIIDGDGGVRDLNENGAFRERAQ